MTGTVLVTGVSQYLGSRLAARLAADPSIDRVIGVDSAPPGPIEMDLLGRTEFLRTDIRSPAIVKIMAAERVDTVVHASVTANPGRVGGRTPLKEFNVIGTMQLLAACQRAPSVRRVVVKSTTAVYGSSPRDPGVFTEDMTARAMPRGGYGQDAVEVESYVRGFARRRPDVAVTLLRFASLVGPQVDTTLTRYFARPVVPTLVGHDPRLQVVHETDAVEVLRRAAVEDKPGVFNVAGRGVLLLSQAIRRAGRVMIALPPPAVWVAGRAVRRAGRADFSTDQAHLRYGRVVDVTRLTTEFGYLPAFTTEQAFDAFVVGAGITAIIGPRTMRGLELLADGALALAARPFVRPPVADPVGGVR